MSALVYPAINAVTADLAENGIAKNRRNENGDYSYRSIDDVLNALAPLLASHRLCILPRVIERQAARQSSGRTDQLVVLRVAFQLVSAIDGSSHTVESFGEALDDSDKGTAKAMSAAYKSAMVQVFCVPVTQDDSDASSHRPRPNGRSAPALPEPAEGWPNWSAEVIDIAASCETTEAIDRLLSRRRTTLNALQRSRPELYSEVGEAIASRLTDLQRPSSRPLFGSGPNTKHKKQEKKNAACAASQAA